MTRPGPPALLPTGRRPAVAAILLAAVALVLGSLSPASTVHAQEGGPGTPRPTIVLVHGAWADASSWSKVITRLQRGGYTVAAIANPLRSLSGDAAYVRTRLETLTGPIVLVGHSYGGAVITNAATGNPDIKALVYVNAFAPDQGETPTALAGPDSALSAPDPTTVFDFVPNTLPPTPATDLYLKRATVFASFATGLNPQDKALLAATSDRPPSARSTSRPQPRPGGRSRRGTSSAPTTRSSRPPPSGRWLNGPAPPSPSTTPGISA
ncbi:alpha/beta fold hydrolase [Actinomadura sp. GTD37]|uniref:alpha/beta fold hydrolase n=1 Tax=Actinomadura sp. GTD37 TaxID=1778030 RepID=UPI0035BED754